MKEIYNGDMGNIDEIDPEAGELTTSFDGRSVTYVLIPTEVARRSGMISPTIPI